MGSPLKAIFFKVASFVAATSVKLNVYVCLVTPSRAVTSIVAAPGTAVACVIFCEAKVLFVVAVITGKANPDGRSIL